MAENGVGRPEKLVVIGGSTGSIDVLLSVLPMVQVPLTGAAIVIVVHRKNTADSALSAVLALRTSLPVHEVDDKDLVQPGHIYLAPADYHLLFEHDGTFSLDDSEKINYSRPSIDVTFESAADVYGPAVVGIILSGANADGTEGFRAIKQAGGILVAQRPDTAQVGYMPNQAILHTPVDHILSIEQIGAFINGGKG
ncbi:chemotaxis protein CheB [Rudanella paleaurantiibacter]|uniref:protein-glutamate methylesterase n=1 Tax=Rudanella paleaurantiibacter TaxID=2614655 RepID=A0A7J5U5U7_9BACT|nr:chemotaxis protein CheB [Rudanella paleaurantiibacter]KAB7733156.1 chemotaxis protein CheB [Rudanella paleaurantiibacter]